MNTRHWIDFTHQSASDGHPHEVDATRRVRVRGSAWLASACENGRKTMSELPHVSALRFIGAVWKNAVHFASMSVSSSSCRTSLGAPASRAEPPVTAASSIAFWSIRATQHIIPWLGGDREEDVNPGMPPNCKHQSAPDEHGGAHCTARVGGTA